MCCACDPNERLSAPSICFVCIFLNCDDVCMCVVNKQFELLEVFSGSVYVDLQYDEISFTFTAAPVCLCGVSSPVVVLGLFVRLS